MVFVAACAEATGTSAAASAASAVERGDTARPYSRGPTKGKRRRVNRTRRRSLSSGCDERRRVAVRLPALGLLHQRDRRGEALAVGLGELTRAGDEAGEASVVAVDVLQDAAGPAGEPDAHDGADVRIGDGLDDTLVQTLHGLDRFCEQHPLFEIFERDGARVRDGRE